MWCVIPCVQTYVTQLSPSDENLVIAAEAFLHISPPREVATLLQHFDAGTLGDIKRALKCVKEQQLEMLKQQQAAEAEVVRTGGPAASSITAQRQVAGVAAAGSMQQHPLAEVRAPHSFL